MTVRVAVSDPLPMYRRGLIASLSGLGVEIEAPRDVLAWALAADKRVILFAVVQPTDWDVLDSLCRADSGVLVLALLEAPDVATYVRAISAGAVGAVSRAVEEVDLHAMFHAAVAGQTVLPTDVVRALAERSSAVEAAPGEPSAQAKGWLRELAAGETVATLANRADYSERMMFRHLRDLYRTLGVSRRTEALILAKERGWL